MKIIGVDVITIKGSGAGRPVLCRVMTDEGIYGYGEAALTIGIGSGPVRAAIMDMAPMVMGMDPFANEAVWEKLRHASFWGLSNGVILMAAISAIDMALWDIKGKACQVPLYKLLGGKCRDRLRSYASQVHFGWGLDASAPDCPKVASPEWFRMSAKAAVGEGFDAIKIGVIFHDIEGGYITYQDASGLLTPVLRKLAEERLAAARDGAGPDVDIILEHHSLTNATSSVQIGKMAEKYDILFMEEATAPVNPEVMRRIADQISIPLATGERTYTRWGYLPFLENGSLAVIQPDIGTCGGITEAKKICDMAHVYDVGVQVHLASTPVSYAAGLHLAAAIPNFVIHEHHIIANNPAMVEMCLYDYRPIQGYAEVPERPGLGQELTEKALSEADIVNVTEQ